MSKLLDMFEEPSLSDTHQHHYDNNREPASAPTQLVHADQIELKLNDENEMSAHWTQPMTKATQFTYGLLNYLGMMLITGVVSYAFHAWTFFFMAANVCFIWLLMKTLFFSGREHHSLVVPEEKRLENEQEMKNLISQHINQGYLA
jgi:hypothetical protein